MLIYIARRFISGPVWRGIRQPSVVIPLVLSLYLRKVLLVVLYIALIVVFLIHDYLIFVELNYS